VRFLLDVNVLVAWGWADHVEHERTVSWIAFMKRRRGVRIATSAIPQLGFVRVSVQRAAGGISIENAVKVLGGMTESLGELHSFVADDQVCVDPFPDWCRAAARTTDGHLVQLAEKHGFRLATLDSQIPGAYLIPKLGEGGPE
jgi:uncharacterized protein